MRQKQKRISRKAEHIIVWCGRGCAVIGVLLCLTAAGYFYLLGQEKQGELNSSTEGVGVGTLWGRGEEAEPVWVQERRDRENDTEADESNTQIENAVDAENSRTEDIQFQESNSEADAGTSTEVNIGTDTGIKIGTNTGYNTGTDIEVPWNLILINPWNSLPRDFTVSRVALKDGHSIDSRCYPELQAMMDDCRAAGLSPYICSSYRTYEKQNQLFENNVKTLMAQGYSESEARAKTAQSIARPGTSEHQLGLAVDIVDINYQVLDEQQENTKVQQWLIEHCWEYGFILRYPTDKREITGITYEPWHYRYVGKEVAEVIHREGICLEEYYEKYLLP